MEVLKTKKTDELLKSLLAEAAKATNEIKCAQGDLNQAQNRLSFILVLANEMISRKED